MPMWDDYFNEFETLSEEVKKALEGFEQGNVILTRETIQGSKIDSNMRELKREIYIVLRLVLPH